MNHQTSDIVDVLGVPIHALTRRELLEGIVSIVRSGRRAKVMYANAHVLNTAYTDRELWRALTQADIVYCDGAGVRMASRLLRGRLPERMTGADWIYDLCRVSREAGLGLYFLGGEPGVAAQAAGQLRQEYPGLAVAGTHHGFYELDGAENDRVVAGINATRPDILLVGLGTPQQEMWITENFGRLKAPVAWAGGAVADFVTGRQSRGPQWMVEHNLEWLGRLSSDPGRLWRRYLIGNPLFLFRVLKQRLGLHRW